MNPPWEGAGFRNPYRVHWPIRPFSVPKAQNGGKSPLTRVKWGFKESYPQALCHFRAYKVPCMGYPQVIHRRNPQAYPQVGR